MTHKDDIAYAQKLDREDALAHLRCEFHFPEQSNGKKDLYLLGNSLGLQPVKTESCIQEELKKWQKGAIRGYFEGEHPWLAFQERLAQPMADLVGALSKEVVVMNTLTANLHFMMASFYKPTTNRFKILIEEHAFPSDHFAVESQIKQHGLCVESSLIKISPRPGEDLLRMEDIEASITEHGSEIALILLPGVQYYTGQVLDMQAITQLGHQYGCTVGFDLAHAVGNIELELHRWGVDFACWCTYKYLNSGPGSIGACFIHETHTSNPSIHRLAGWWGHNKETRFEMGAQFDPMLTAQGWQVSCPPILAMAPIIASLELFERAGGMSTLRQKSQMLSSYMIYLIKERLLGRVEVITPENPEERGCQLSLKILAADGKQMFDELEKNGVICDWRYPCVIRVAAVPLYNSFEDVYLFIDTLERLLRKQDQ
ncbi:MAG: kynureninase [Gammaproteobacteria bacterium]